MNDREIKNEINDLFHTYKIGHIIDNPLRITGGLMHQMYKVTTETGAYAVKWLNPSIMQRDGVMDNMINSERIANAFSSYLPVVAALNFEESTVLHLKDRYYMVFNWIEGASIFPPLIKVENCYEIGNALGKIHGLNISIPQVKKGNIDSLIYDWKNYFEKGKKVKAEWVNIYVGVIDKLNLWMKQVNDANSILSEQRVISHGDLDPKNVMWNEGNPYLIDWEAAGYVNPYQELLEILNYWSDNGNGGLDKDKFNILLSGYRKYMSTKMVNWDIVLDSGYAGMLGWLDYSLKRALGIESADEEERKLGEVQVLGTIAALEKYDNQKILIKEWLSDVEPMECIKQ